MDIVGPFSLLEEGLFGKEIRGEEDNDIALGIHGRAGVGL